MKMEDVIKSLGEGFEAMKATVDELKKHGDPVTAEKLTRITKELAELDGIKSKLDAVEKLAARPRGDVKEDTARELKAAREALHGAITKNERSALDGVNKEQKQFNMGTSAAGGFLVPTVVETQISRLITDISPFRSVVRVSKSSLPDYRVNVNVRGQVAQWSAEAAARVLGATSSFAQVTYSSGELYAYADVTRWLVESAQSDILAEMDMDIADQFDAAEGIAIVSGDGVNKPRGFLNGPAPLATADGVRAFGTLQYKPTGAAATFAASNPADVLTDLAYTIKAGYRKNARWAMNKNTLGTVMKFKDGQGNYLWRPGLVAGQPSTINGYAVMEMEAMPDIAANAFPIAFGDWYRAYRLIDVAGMAVIRDEVTTPGMLKIYMARRVGGGLENTEALKLLKVAVA